MSEARDLHATPALREAHKTLVLARIERQRQQRLARPRASAEALSEGLSPAEADVAGAAGAARSSMPPGADFPRSQTLRLVMRHPVAAVAVAGAVIALGPRRLVTLTTWLLPWLLRGR